MRGKEKGTFILSLSRTFPEIIVRALYFSFYPNILSHIRSCADGLTHRYRNELRAMYIQSTSRLTLHQNRAWLTRWWGAALVATNSQYIFADNQRNLIPIKNNWCKCEIVCKRYYRHVDEAILCSDATDPRFNLVANGDAKRVTDNNY